MYKENPSQDLKSNLIPKFLYEKAFHWLYPGFSSYSSILNYTSNFILIQHMHTYKYTDHNLYMLAFYDY